MIRSKLNRENPEIESVAHIWRTAEFHEREVYEMFGVNFLNHPRSAFIDPARWMGRKESNEKRF
jgi:NADH:ubiquinone oxidoreductase subunit C